MPVPHRIRHALIPIALALGLAGGIPAASASGPTPTAISNCNGHYPASYARFWHDQPWPVTSKNKEYQVKSPDGDRYLYITGGGYYANRTNPKLPRGTYHEYDTEFNTAAGASRGPARFVRERVDKRLYYTPDHYRSWCYVGKRYG